MVVTLIYRSYNVAGSSDKIRYNRVWGGTEQNQGSTGEGTGFWYYRKPSILYPACHCFMRNLYYAREPRNEIHVTLHGGPKR